MTPTLRVKRLPHAADLPLPAYAQPGDAGMDLRAAIDPDRWVKTWRDGGEMGSPPYSDSLPGSSVPPFLHIFPGDRALIPCGFCFGIPDGFEGQVRPRSGASWRGLSVVLGTVDAGYRGEVFVHVHNIGAESVTITRGDRIAQLVIAPVARAKVEEVEDLDETERGAGGFGSTGSR